MAGWEVHPRGARRTGRLRFALIVALLAIPAAFMLGAYWHDEQMQAQRDQMQPLQDQLAKQEAEIEGLKQSLAKAVSGANVSVQANEQNRLTIKLLEEQIFKQQQDLASYKGVLAPNSRQDGLRIGTFELQSTEKPRNYRYKILLSRVGKDDKPLSGQLRVTVEGKKAGKSVKLELSELTTGASEQFSGKVMPFTFKHFKSIPEAGRFAELQIPEGFEPKQVRVRAEVKGEKPLERTFKWIDKE